MNKDNVSIFDTKNFVKISELYNVVDTLNNIFQTQKYEALSNFYLEEFDVFSDIFELSLRKVLDDNALSFSKKNFLYKDSNYFKNLLKNFRCFLPFYNKIEILDCYDDIDKKFDYFDRSFRSSKKLFIVFNIPNGKKERFSLECNFYFDNFKVCYMFLFHFLLITAYGFITLINDSDSMFLFKKVHHFIHFFDVSSVNQIINEDYHFLSSSSNALNNLLTVSLPHNNGVSYKLFESFSINGFTLETVHFSAVYKCSTFSSYLSLFFGIFILLISRGFCSLSDIDFMVHYKNYLFELLKEEISFTDIQTLEPYVFFDINTLKSRLEIFLERKYFYDNNILAISDNMLGSYNIESFIDFFFDSCSNLK